MILLLNAVIKPLSKRKKHRKPFICFTITKQHIPIVDTSIYITYYS